MTIIARITATLGMLGVLALFAATPVQAHRGTPNIVCLDAGHGGDPAAGGDPGAKHHGLSEAELNLIIVETFLAPMLQTKGYGVVLTRTSAKNVNLGNTERANICNAGSSTLVVSVHMNASTDYGLNYFKPFYGKRTKDQAFADTLGAKYRLPKVPLTSPITYVKVNPSGQFASGLLLKATGHAVIAETVFISNTDEANALKAGIQDGTYARHKAIAEQLGVGIDAWYTTTH